jgi:hypothetical protein
MGEPIEPFYTVLKPQSWPYTNEIPNLLGRIVKNLYSPYDYFSPAAPGNHSERKLIVHGPLKDFKLSAEASHKHRGGGKLEKIGDISGGVSEELMTELRGKTVWAIRLQQLDTIFRHITADPTTQETVCEWLGNILSAKEAYFIAGLLVAEDASISMTETKNKDISASSTMPISTMAQFAAGSPITIPVGDLSVEGQKSSSLLRSLEGQVEGQRIIAIDYRVVLRSHLGPLVGRSPLTLEDRNPRKIHQARKFNSDDAGSQSPIPPEYMDLMQVRLASAPGASERSYTVVDGQATNEKGQDEN